jgi:uncharacterized protein with NRDE domain
MNMSKVLIYSIGLAMLVVSCALFYYANTMTDPQVVLDSYYARREDITLSQYNIEQAIAELNQTILRESQNQQSLTQKVAELAVKANSSPPIINTTTYVQEPPTVVRVPVTRAS